jgi:DNA-binding beta-propeller fold protein YncE
MGSDPGEFLNPQGIAVGLGNEIFVVDSQRHDVQVFAADGTYLRSLGSFGTLPGQFSYPNSVAIANDGTVYVTALDQRVQHLTAQGDFLAEWAVAGALFGLPVDVGPDGSVYVADTANDRVLKFTGDGTFLLEWGSHCQLSGGAGGGCIGEGEGQFNAPQGIAISPQGNVYVSDTHNFRIQKFDANGTFLGMWGWGPSDGDGEFKDPDGLTADDAGNVYVADLHNDRVQVFDVDGAFLGKWGTEGTNPGEFRRPRDIAIDSNGNVYVVDGLNRRIQKFSGSVTSADPRPELLLTWTPLRSPSPAPVRLLLAGQPGVLSRVALFDATGRLVSRMGRYVLTGSPLEVLWDGRDAAGRPVSAGVYFMRAQAGSAVAHQRIVLLHD